MPMSIAAFCMFFDVKSVENKNQDEGISDK